MLCILFLVFAVIVWGIPATLHRWNAIKAWSRGPYNPFFILGSSYEDIVAEYGVPHAFSQGDHNWHNLSEDRYSMTYAIDYREDHRAVDDFWYICIHLDKKGKAYFVCAEWSPGGIARRSPDLSNSEHQIMKPDPPQFSVPNKTAPPIGWLIGCAAAGVLGIAAMIVPIFFRRRKARSDGPASNENP